MELDELAVLSVAGRPHDRAELLARAAMRTRAPVFPIQLSRKAMLDRLQIAGIEPWRITGNGQRLDERSDTYLAERLHRTLDGAFS